MKPYLFPIFITFLGLFTAYVFYAFWHTEAVNPPKIVEIAKERVVEDLSNKPIIPKNTLTVPEASLATHTQAQEEKEMLEEMQKHVDIPNLTPQQMEAQTQAVYDSLTPENHEETMAEAATAFEALDAHVLEVDVQLEEQMQAVEEAQEELISETEVEPQENQTMEIPENEEEIDMEQEDVNNVPSP